MTVRVIIAAVATTRRTNIRVARLGRSRLGKGRLGKQQAKKGAYKANVRLDKGLSGQGPSKSQAKRYLG